MLSLPPQNDSSELICLKSNFRVLFVRSLEMGALPRDWRQANITPVHKRGCKNDPSNYRPISLTSLVVKLMEKIVARKITAFFNTHHKLLQTQHGFRRNRSCQSQLLEAVHDWAKALDDGIDAHAIFLDFSRAFDSVPHR